MKECGHQKRLWSPGRTLSFFKSESKCIYLVLYSTSCSASWIVKLILGAYVGLGVCWDSLRPRSCPLVAPLEVKHRCKPTYSLKNAWLSVLHPRVMNCWAQMWSQPAKANGLGIACLCCALWPSGLGMWLGAGTSIGHIVNIPSLYTFFTLYTTFFTIFRLLAPVPFSGWCHFLLPFFLI